MFIILLTHKAHCTFGIGILFWEECTVMDKEGSNDIGEGEAACRQGEAVGNFKSWMIPDVFSFQVP